MTAATLDVNEAFASEKANQITATYEARASYERRLADYESGAAQARLDEKLAADVAAGKIEMVGPDRYRALTGWDRGETFRVQKATKPGEVSLVLPEHGLDVLDNGQVALYKKGLPAWHGLGQVIPEGVTDVDEVLRLGGINYDQVQLPAQYLWNTSFTPGSAYQAQVAEDGSIRFLTEDGEDAGELRTVPRAFVNARDDNGNAFGVVGRIWRPVQASTVFGFLQELTGQFGLVWESAGAIEGGKRMFVAVRLPGTVTIDAEGINDQIIPFIVAIDDRTGNASFQTVATPWLPVCGNTERLASANAFSRWATRHTTNADQRVEEARRQLGLSLNYFEAFRAEEEALARSSYEIDAFQKLMADLFPVDEEKVKESARTRNYVQRRSDALEELWALESNRVGKTAYAAERAVTNYLDNAKPRRGPTDQRSLSAAAAALEGDDDDIKAKAHKQLLLVANR